ncbi:hypothetical protein [Malikia spinosa]|jgi:hypothetical protein|uniref:hypothetical protein n=1 Tax=Malikia spinosa TaxID=86180 RepID=UPI003FA2A04C
MPNDEEIRELLADPGLSDWFKQALSSSLDRDPVDAANDAELLSAVLDRRSRAIAADALTSLVIRDAGRR